MTANRVGLFSSQVKPKEVCSYTNVGNGLGSLQVFRDRTHSSQGFSWLCKALAFLGRSGTDNDNRCYAFSATRETLHKCYGFIGDWKYTRIYNPQRRLRVLVEMCSKDSSQRLYTAEPDYSGAWIDQVEIKLNGDV
ncbi:hypothetical protein TNCV_494321 [Trichonephila clavipes]|nr:hypothetical protein TNCV_494321 [Trichonephila clavipes]